MRDGQWRSWREMRFFQRALLVVIAPLALVVILTAVVVVSIWDGVLWWLDRFGEWLSPEL